MKTPEVQLYERRVKGLGNSLAGKTQYWRVDMGKAFASKKYSSLPWPHCYEIVATLPTSDLTEAVNLSREKYGWLRSGVQLMPPYGYTVEKLPPPGSDHDVYVTPDGSVYRLVGNKASVLNHVPIARKLRPPRKRKMRWRLPAFNVRRRRDDVRPYRYRSRYQIDRAKELIANILIFLMAAGIFGLVRMLNQ